MRLNCFLLYVTKCSRVRSASTSFRTRDSPKDDIWCACPGLWNPVNLMAQRYGSIAQLGSVAGTASSAFLPLLDFSSAPNIESPSLEDVSERDSFSSSSPALVCIPRLPLMMILCLSFSGEGSASIPILSTSGSRMRSISPKISRQISHILFWKSWEQCISIEMITGYGLFAGCANADSFRTWMTSLKRILEQKVLPCVTIGSVPGFPSGMLNAPSQQSISTHRQPFCSTYEYCSALEIPCSWSPVR
mmetsp:Transcript_16377/g.36618  ORF Transcript_16377/g.36618 Transcript_16377/m.36618 type:complete len:247 (-) Transcript_16377:421-1161(-)